MRFKRRLRQVRHYSYEFSRNALSLALCALLAGGCIPAVKPSPEPQSGLHDYQVQTGAFAEIPGGLVNTNGGNLVVSWVGLSLPTALHVSEETGAIYNSASGKWQFPYQMTYDGSTLEDHTGAVYDVTGLADGETIPGSYWVKVDADTIMTKGQLVHEFDANGALIEKYWLGQICPWIQYIPGVDETGASILKIQQYDCGGSLEWRSFNRLLFNVIYNAQGRVASIEDPESGRTALLTYNADGLLETARDGQAVENGWPGFQYEYSGSNLTAITNSEGERIEYEYYAPMPGGLDRLQYVTRIGEGNPQYSLVYYAKNMQGVYTTVLTDPLGEKIRYRFDEQRRLRKIEYDTLELMKLYGYEPLGPGLRPTSVTAINGATTRHTYIGDDIATTELPSGNVLLYTYADGNNKSFPLNRAIAEVQDNLGLVEERLYTVGDPVDKRRLAAIINGEGEATSYDWCEHGGFTRLCSVTSASGIDRLFEEYNSTGQATKIIQGGVLALAAYDTTGNRVKGRPDSPEQGGVRGRLFDGNGNLVQVTVASTDSDGNVTGLDVIDITRRSDGQETYIARPGGVDHEFIHNALGQLVERRERVDGAWESAFFEYDLIGRMTAFQLPNGMREEYDLDQLGRLVERRAYRDGNLEGRIEYTYLNGSLYSAYDSIRDATEFYFYDFAGRLQKTQYDHGETLTLGYDIRSRVTSETYKLADDSVVKVIEYRYDLADRKTQVYDGEVGAGGQLVLDYTYQDGQVVSICTGNDLCRGFTYDSDFGVRESATTRDLITDEVIETTNLSLDLLKDPAVWTVSASTTVDSPSLSETITEEYLIGPGVQEGAPEDAVGMRVFRSAVDGASKHYAYDPLSNLENTDGDSFIYNAEGNRLLEATVDGVTVDYAYDEAGFATSRDGVSITWTATGRMSSFGDVTFEWDMRDRLLSWSNPVGGRDWSWFGGRIEAVGGVPATLDLLEVVLDLQTGDRFYRHSDFRGNVRFASDSSGDIVTLNGYDPYGVSVTHGDASDAVHFVGRQEFAGLMILGARIYDPHARRFLSPDPIFQALNQYTYTFGNPIWFNDRDGQHVECTNGEWSVIFSIGGLNIAVIGTHFATSPALYTLGAVGIAVALGGLVFGLMSLAPVADVGAGNPGADVSGVSQGKCIVFSDGTDPGTGGSGATSSGTIPLGGNSGGNNPGPGGLGTQGAAALFGGGPAPGLDGFGGIGGIGCGIGFELAFLLPVLMWLDSRRRRK